MMSDLEFVKHRFAGKIKEIIKTYKTIYMNHIINKDNLDNNCYLCGLLYGTGLKINSIRNLCVDTHYVIKVNDNKKVAKINLDTEMIESI